MTDRSIAEDRMTRFRELGQVRSMEMRNPAVREVFQRMEREGVPVRDMRDPTLGMFMAPFCRNVSELDIACVGVPMENSVPLRTGTHLGPAAVREWSQWQGPVHELWANPPFELFSVGDYGDIEFSSPDLDDRINQIYELYATFAAAGVSTLSVGGEHTMTFPILKAAGQRQPLGLLHIDAHADTGGALMPGDTDPLSLNDASPFRHAVLSGALDPARTVQIGIRGRGASFWDFSHESGMRVITATEFYNRGVDDVIREVRKVVGEGPCYLSIDNDGIDPIDMPATGLPEPFGLRVHDVRRLIRGTHGLDYVGADFAELSPANDPTGQSSNLSAALCFEMLCLLSEARSARSPSRRKTHWTR